MDIESLIATYGYAALFAGVLLEGETIVIIAGFLVHQGYLHLLPVMLVAFIGAFTADQFIFQVGKRKGVKFLAGRPHWQTRVDKVRRFIVQYQVIAILGYRFLYGMRTITPLVIGASGFATRRFILLNLCSTLLWGTAVSTAGYFFGHVIELFLTDVRRYEMAALITIAATALAVWLYRYHIRKSRSSGVRVEIVTARGWDDLYDSLRDQRGVVLFAGTTDAGKSTLIRWLVERRGREKLVTALVDADVGQSALCLPGTVGMAVFGGAGAAQEYTCTRFSFLGTPNPARIINILVETVGRYAQMARSEAKLVLVDTTGLIEGGLGIGLKLAKVRTTQADMVVAVQREDECEQILGRLRNVEIYRLLRAPAATLRHQEARAKRRAERLKSYLRKPAMNASFTATRWNFRSSGGG